MADKINRISLLKSKSNHIDLIDFLIFILANLKYILICISIMLAFTIVQITFFLKDNYQSTAKILSSKKSNSSGIAGLASQFGVEIPIGNQDPEWAYNEILKSRTLARELINKNYDTKKYGKNILFSSILLKEFGIEEDDETKIQSIAIDKFLNHMLFVTDNNKTNVIKISINAFEPKLARDLVKDLIAELGNHQKNFVKNNTSEIKIFIEERISETQVELEAKEEDLKDFMARNRRIENSPLLQLQQNRLSREVTVLIGVFTTLKQQYETTKIEEYRDADHIIILDEPEIPTSKLDPRIGLRILFAIIFGVGTGMLIALIFDYSKNLNKTDAEKIALLKSRLNWNKI